jgi:hypothetical protein
MTRQNAPFGWLCMHGHNITKEVSGGMNELAKDANAHLVL